MALPAKRVAFTEEVECVLVELYGERLAIIEGAGNTADSNKKRNQAWADIAERLKACGAGTYEAKSLRTKIKVRQESCHVCSLPHCTYVAEHEDRHEERRVA